LSSEAAGEFNFLSNRKIMEVAEKERVSPRL